MKTLTLEINSKFKKSIDTFKVKNMQVTITPAIGKEYFLFRVKLTKTQAILAFPKFYTLGIGFALESDWNTNLPYNCRTKEIFEHIKENKRYKSISDKDCLEAIKILQIACKKYETLSPELSKN